MRQRVVKFGGATPLSGVLTEPGTGDGHEHPWVILLNSGILHHVGVNRLHVQIARRLAEQGYGSLRFDFSGLGDSESRRDNLSFEQSAPLETRDAIDFLARAQGAQRVALVGLCSGADVAHLAALDDDRVVGLGLLDPWAYKTRGYWLHYYGSRVVSLERYRHWIRIRWERIKEKLSQSPLHDERDAEMYEMPGYLREFPPRERVAADLRQFISRGTELLFIFSGGLEEYNHQGQYAASFPEVSFNGRLLEAHVPAATHVFSAVEHQEFVVRTLSNWMRNRLAAASADGDAAIRKAV